LGCGYLSAKTAFYLFMCYFVDIVALSVTAKIYQHGPILWMRSISRLVVGEDFPCLQIAFGIPVGFRSIDGDLVFFNPPWVVGRFTDSTRPRLDITRHACNDKEVEDAGNDEGNSGAN
jgi:hypothetical protein